MIKITAEIIAENPIEPKITVEASVAKHDEVVFKDPHGNIIMKANPYDIVRAAMAVIPNPVFPALGKMESSDEV